MKEGNDGWVNMRDPRPGHDDEHPSFSFKKETGVFQLHGGDSGNYQTIYAECYGISLEEAYEQIKKEKGYWDDVGGKRIKCEYSLSQYATDKMLPIDKLKECAEHIEVKDQTTRETISRLQDTLVRLEAVQEAQQAKQTEN
jgi:hypothetical protein